jgi:glutamate 5-kinase
VLFIYVDFANRKRFLNARRALGELERRHAVAVINENDTVSFEEIAFGDNDELAAQVSNLVDAHLLIMLSTAPGVVNESGVRLPEALASDSLLDALAQPGASRFGKGGMMSKLRAARVASSRGAYVAILEGKRPGQIAALLDGQDVGTLLLPNEAKGKLSSRAHWIAHTLRPAGKLVIDAGAANALRDQSKSLLPSGIRAVIGDFAEGDPVEIAIGNAAHHEVIARGLVRYSAEQMERIQGLPSSAIEGVLGFTSGDAAVHRDDLVLLE